VLNESKYLEFFDVLNVIFALKEDKYLEFFDVLNQILKSDNFLWKKGKCLKFLKLKCSKMWLKF
jgi:hypothetical protein